MTFSEAFGFDLCESIAIIGSHGKTSLCYLLSSENSHKKVALTTTTKIFKIANKDLHVKNFYDYYGKDLPNTLQYGVNVFGKFYKENKISSLSQNDLKKLKDISDILIYEADGSRQKPLKAWSGYEPVFVDQTDTIIGILPINCINLHVSEDIVHRYDLFCEKFATKQNDKIDENLMINITKEMFSKAPKNTRKILFLNRCEDLHVNSAKQIANALENIEVYAGSIHNKTIKKIK
ncbi:MAG: putative selenium-dependent hydroxylase accessory protein YqeC [Campylobacteraceae bacterium]|nr:putative selenium-dependent hydroxylase accessory protein YqeC [Campylobacteraceae bacterium]